MPRKPKTATRVRRSTEERQHDTISAVIELAATDAPERLTTARIARHMGLSDAILFRHFPSKAAVWAAVMKWVTGTLEARFGKAELGADSALEVLERLFHRHIDFAHAHPGVPRLLFSELQRPDDTAAKRITREFLARHATRVRRWLEKGRASGEFRSDLDADAASTLFIGCIQGLVVQTLLSGDPDQLQRSAPGTFDLFRHSIISPS
ncbi:MAG: TetR/AcrR family transcriptional regulator [Akkermansiaceae bacterium]|nr:TetR/AcrR family transcriptional regulator [Akkermansiaceae bacterium]